MSTNRAQLGFRFAPPAKPGDICARKHKHNPQSVAANLKAEPTKASMRERIRLFVSGCGHYGATLNEIAEYLETWPNKISGRFTELVSDGIIFKSGRVRSGCAVYVQYAGWVNGSTKEIQ